MRPVGCDPVDRDRPYRGLSASSSEKVPADGGEIDIEPREVRNEGERLARGARGDVLLPPPAAANGPLILVGNAGDGVLASGDTGVDGP